MVVDSWKFEPNQNDVEVDSDCHLNSPFQKGTMSCTGFLRGKSLNVNNLVHITTFNQAFQLKQVDGVSDPFSSNKANTSETMDVETTQVGRTVFLDNNSQNTQSETQVLAVPNPERQDSLESENTPDPFAAEQTWPTQEELQEAEGEYRECHKSNIFRQDEAYQRRQSCQEEGAKRNF